jgi:hypothetical protein
MKASTLLCIGLLAASTAALAQQRLQPGLWEQSMTTKNDKMNQAMAQMQQQMASMPPEKRKQMEAMMAQQGVNMGGAGGVITAKVCITPEQAARDEASRASARDARPVAAATASAGVSQEPPQTLTLGSARNCGAVSA